MRNGIFIFILISLGAMGCSKPKDSSQRQIPGDIGAIKEATLEVRNQKDNGPDNWDKSALYLTDYDRRFNLSMLFIENDSNVTNDTLPALSETCVSGGSCGFVKPDEGSTLNSIDLKTADVKIKNVGIQSHYDMRRATQFKEGDVWIYTSTEPAYAGGPNWRITLVIELEDFKPHADKVTLKYKVLEFQKL